MSKTANILNLIIYNDVDGVTRAICNSRRYGWGHIGGEMGRYHTKAVADESYAFLKRMIEPGADVNRVSGLGHKTPKEAHKDQGAWLMWGELFQ